MAKSYRKDIHGSNPYYDDFNPAKKFVRVMSRPGFPLQAREITQLQTILQNQIERFGDHFFEEGASVNGGEITETNGVAIRLKDTDFTEEVLKSFHNKVITNETSGVQARIIAHADSSASLVDDNYQILFVTYITSGQFSASEVLKILGTLPEVEVTVIESGLAADAISNVTNIVGVASGIYYSDGFFVESDSDTTAAFASGSGVRNFENPSSSIGFDIKRELVSSEEDDTLKDPSFGFYNFNSPGADRYKVTLELTQKEFTGEGITFESSDYFEVMRIVNGQTTKQVRYTDYALFEETLARRTFDESGNYTVRPFPITTDTYLTAFGTRSSEQHAIKIDPGKAYVGGYEFETTAPKYIAIDRGLTTNVVNNAILSTPLENYVDILKSESFESRSSGDNQLRDTFLKNRKATVQHETSAGITALGTCNIRTIEQTAGGSTRLYLFNINMTATGAGSGFGNATHIAVGDTTEEDNTNRFKLATANIDTALESVGQSRQIFKAPVGSGLIRATSKDGLNSSFLVKKAYNFEMSGGNPAVITSTKPFLQGSQVSYSVFYTTNTADGSDGATLMNVGTDMKLLVANNQSNPTLTITRGTGIPDGGKGTIIASQEWQSDASGVDQENNIRQKTLVDATSSNISGPVSTGIIPLDHCDVFSITEISDGTRSLLNDFDLDVNSGVDAYRRSRLILKAGATCATDPNDPTKFLLDSVQYKRFDHSGEGPFTVDSYPLEQITYDEIPTFTDPETGETYSLADAYDFRPIAIDANETGFDNGNGEPQVVAFQNNIILSTVSYEHYLGRVDNIVLDRQTRDFKIIKGEPAINPKPPEIDSLDMNLGDLRVPPYTPTSSDIKYRYIDNQRTTMREINELETTTQFDSYFTFKSDLEQQVLNRAQNFRANKTALADGIFVDTFIGHNNSVTAKRDHNCSIDPEFGELRPAFETTFIRMGITGASSGSNITRTDDNIYIPNSVSTAYALNLQANDTISANQFSVSDFLGTATLSPSSDPFFSQQIRPKVIVNTVGEVDNWETSISAFQRGRTKGFGAQWRDWESLWFGSRKRNDNEIPHDSGGSEYTNPRTSSYVSRIISDKLIKKIGNKIVDLSVVPYCTYRNVTVTCNNLKPTQHYVFFDGVQKGGMSVNNSGFGQMTFNIPSNTHLTGKKLVRVTDTPDGDIATATSSADAIYYAEGLLDTKEGDSYSVRPVITRRKASNVEDSSSDYYEANSSGNLSRSFNSLTPFAQEINVDPSEYPNGIMLKDIDLFFAEIPTNERGVIGPVKVHIRPMFNGSPHPFKVLPFSEVTRSDITAGDYDSQDGVNFEFSTPVYLKPNVNYAICISTNSDYKLYYAEDLKNVLQGASISPIEGNITAMKPRHFERLHLPLNNGTITAFDNKFLKMKINRCAFVDLNATDSFVQFNSPSQIRTTPHHVSFVHSNEQVTDAVRPTYELTTSNYNADGNSVRTVQPNTTIDDHEQKRVLSGPKPVKIKTVFATDADQAVASMIDGDRLGYAAIEYMANNDDVAAISEELEPTSRLATNRSRYIGRKVSLSGEAGDIVVIVDGSFIDNSQIKVYVKLQGPDQPNGNFDDNPYEELFPEGLVGEGSSTSEIFNELKPIGEDGGILRFTTNSTSPGTSTKFTAYQIKIVLMGQNIDNSGTAKQIPVIRTVGAVPLKSVSQDEIRRFIPVGTIFPFARNVPPDGYVACDGSKLNYVETPQFKPLFDAIGTAFNDGTEGENEFSVPNINGRTIVGIGDSGTTDSVDRSLADKFGLDQFTLTETQVPLPLHFHGTGYIDKDDDTYFPIAGEENEHGFMGQPGFGNQKVALISGDGPDGSDPTTGRTMRSVSANVNASTEYIREDSIIYPALTTYQVRPSVSSETNGFLGGFPPRPGTITPAEFTGNTRGYDTEVSLDKITNTQPSIALNYIIKF